MPLILLASIEALKHFSLILALLYLYAQLLPRFATRSRFQVLVLQSALFSLVAVISMFISTSIVPGYYTDSRTVIVMTAAASAGPIPAFIAAAFATLARLAYPLDGFVNGVVSVFLAAALGSLYYRFEHSGRIRGTRKELLLTGFTLAVLKIAILVAFAGENQTYYLALVALPSLLLFPTAFILSFTLLRRELRQFKTSRRSADYRQQFDVAIQSSPVGIIIYRLVDRRCVYANEMAAKALHTTVLALVGRRMPLFEQALPEILVARTAPHDTASVQNHSVLFRLYDGALRWFDLSARPVCFQNRDCQFITLQDVTEQRENRQQLEFSEARFRRFADATSEGILVVAADGIVDANQRTAHLFGYAQEALIGMSLFSLVPTGEAATMQDALRDGADVSFASTGLRGDGTTFPTEVAVRHVHTNGDCLWLVTVRDLTERKQAEAQQVALAVEQEKVRTLHKFIRMTSHDLRTPLAVINTSLYLAQKTEDPTRRLTQLHKAEGQVAILSGILDGIYEWVQLSNAESLCLKPVDINPLLTDLVTRVIPQLEARELSLTLALDPALPPVDASISDLNAAFQALLSNAIMYTPASGRITLRTYTVGEQVGIEIADTGIGIDAVLIDRIFEPFYKADPARNTGEGGPGLGLTIARRIIDLHHGTMTLESHPGRGTAVSILLDASRPSADATLLPHTAPAAHLPSSADERSSNGGHPGGTGVSR